MTFQDTVDIGGGCTALDATEFSRSLSLKGPTLAVAEDKLVLIGLERLQVSNGCNGDGGKQGKRIAGKDKFEIQ